MLGTIGFKYLPPTKAVIIALMMGLSGTQCAFANGLRDILKEWTAQNIYVANDQNGRPKLFVRTGPVRAYIQSGAGSVVPEVRNTIEALSDMFQLTSEFTLNNPNLVVAVAPNIAENGHPNRALLAQLGLPSLAIDLIKQDWSSGCGAHSFADRQGRISVSIVVADTRLGPDGMRDCIQTGVLYAFGLRVKFTSALNATHGTVPYFLLARALRSCRQIDTEERGDASLRSIENKYAECMADFLEAILR
jgi:hypothetical protein